MENAQGRNRRLSLLIIIICDSKRGWTSDLFCSSVCSVPFKAHAAGEPQVLGAVVSAETWHFLPSSYLAQRITSLLT